MTKITNNLGSHSGYLSFTQKIIIIVLVMGLHTGMLFALWGKKKPIMLPQIAPLQIQFIDSQQLQTTKEQMDMATNDQPNDVVSNQTKTFAQKSKKIANKPTQDPPLTIKVNKPLSQTQPTIISQQQSINDLPQASTTNKPQHQEKSYHTNETTKENQPTNEQPQAHQQNQTKKNDKTHDVNDKSSIDKVGVDHQQHSQQPSNDQQNKIASKSGGETQQTLINDWQKQVIIAIERKLQYSPQALNKKWGGKPQVRIVIDPSGKVLSVTLVKSSGKNVLDNEAIATANRASPLPKPPNEILQGASQKSFVIPIHFDYKKYQ